MLFKKEFVKPIQNGRKTETRRTGKKRWIPGNLYWAQLNFAGSSRFARLRVTSVRQECLGDITPEGAYREGFIFQYEFMNWWEKQYGKKPDPRQLVWVVSFEVTEKIHLKLKQ